MSDPRDLFPKLFGGVLRTAFPRAVALAERSHRLSKELEALGADVLAAASEEDEGSAPRRVTVTVTDEGKARGGPR